MNYRLDRFYTENNSSTDTVLYFRNVVDDDPDIRSLMLYSADLQQLYVFGSDKQFKIIPTNQARSFIPDVMYQEEGVNVGAANIWVRKTVGLPDLPMYSVRIPINNKQSLRNIGQLDVYFDTDKVWGSLAMYEDELKGSILVLSADGSVLFDSSGTYYDQKYPYAEQINSMYDTGVLGEGLIATKLTQSQEVTPYSVPFQKRSWPKLITDSATRSLPSAPFAFCLRS